ncbi:MAG: DNA polymerase III subunit delta' [Gammaproteobacteria bacterium]|nr:DNA polymerase III subunit delta' [Gammaproteobacteria bacterium]
MSPKTTLLPWQQQPWQRISQYIQQNRIPQALLITGANGIGKYTLAHRFAAALLCERRTKDGLACGQCHSCTLISAQTHPDFITIVPEVDKMSISINQIRQIVADTYLKPQFDGYRIVIIKPAEVMTIQAINAFLKCLEEPGERTVFILITTKPSKLPATIISRCQQLALSLSDPHTLREWLNSQYIRQNQETLINLVQNSILSLEQIGDAVLLTQRRDCFKDWLAIAKQQMHPVLVSEKWQKLPKQTLINWQLSWLSDVIKCAFRIQHQQMCNQDLVQSIQSLVQQLQLSQVYKLYDKLIYCRQQLDTQLNFQLMLEEVLIQWQGLNRRH